MEMSAPKHTILVNVLVKMNGVEMKEEIMNDVKIAGLDNRRKNVAEKSNAGLEEEVIGSFADSPIGKWKQRHLNAMQLIQAFGESLPQFLLQTAAAFLDWTDGTAKQCFPGWEEERKRDKKRENQSPTGIIWSAVHLPC